MFHAVYSNENAEVFEVDIFCNSWIDAVMIAEEDTEDGWELTELSRVLY